LLIFTADAGSLPQGFVIHDDRPSSREKEESREAIPKVPDVSSSHMTGNTPAENLAVGIGSMSGQAVIEPGILTFPAAGILC
jgi:hypothetical protein